MLFISWLIRYGHVLGAAIWVGGYALLAFFIVPLIGKGAGETLAQLAISSVRILTYAGTLTMGFGIVLITKTNGFVNLIGTLWGACIIAGIVIAVALLGIGDGALRPAIRRVARGEKAPARLWAIIGFVLTVLAVGLMTAATYVG